MLSDWSDLPEPRGLPEPLRRLLAAAYAEMTDRVWVRGGVPVEPAPAPHELKRDYALREQALPSEDDWTEARKRYETVLGDRAPQLRRGRIVNQFAGQIKQAAAVLAQDAGRLVGELEKHRSFLRLDDGSPRLVLARRAQELVKSVTEAGIDAKTVVDRLARFDLGDFTAHRYAMSLKGAGKVAAALQNTSWDQLGLADTLGGRRGRPGAGARCRRRRPGDYPDLPGVLQAGGREVLSLLRSRQTTAEQPQTPATPLPSSDDVDLIGGSAHPQVLPEPVAQPGPRTPSRSVVRSGGGRTTAARAAAELQAEIAALAAENPNATVEVVWRVVD
ncbi:hypothetical protein ACFQ60_03320 [Streptomyces zhihengii]